MSLLGAVFKLAWPYLLVAALLCGAYEYAHHQGAMDQKKVDDTAYGVKLADAAKKLTTCNTSLTAATNSLNADADSFRSLADQTKKNEDRLADVKKSVDAAHAVEQQMLANAAKVEVGWQKREAALVASNGALTAPACSAPDTDY